MAVAALVRRAILEPGYETRQLLDRFLVGLPPLLGGGEFGFSQNSGLRIATRPGNNRGRPCRKQIDPVEGAFLLVEADGAVLDLVLANVVAVEVQVERGFQLAGVGAAAGEFA